VSAPFALRLSRTERVHLARLLHGPTRVRPCLATRRLVGRGLAVRHTGPILGESDKLAANPGASCA